MTRGTNPRALNASESGTGHPAPAPARTLAEELGETADELRRLYTDAGLRPYRVFSVVIRWTGGELGRGRPEVLRETELLPTPLVDFSLRGELRPAGEVERGTARLRQVSPRYAEQELRALFPRALERGEQAFVEVQMDARDAQAPRRRFVVVGAPYRKAGAFEWRVDLRPQDDGRTAAGALAVATETPRRPRRP